MSNLKNQIVQFFQLNGVDVQNRAFLLACSGGIDSMVLAQLLIEIQANFGIAHCNFHLRGNESDQDQLFVKEFAKTNGIPFFTQDFNTQEHANESKTSIQMSARQLRYEFFDEIIENESFDYLLTAHHLDDSLETILINIGRGTGINGLKGIPHFSGKILRPLHLATRKEISQYAENNKLQWREDSSNESDKYQRNYIRKHVIPELKKSHESFDEGLKKSLSNIDKDLRLFNHQLQKIQQDITIVKDGNLHIDIPLLLGYPSCSTILNFILSPFGDFDISAIEKSLQTQSGAEFTGQSYSILKDRDQLIIHPNKSRDEKVYTIEQKARETHKPLAMKISIISEGLEGLERNSENALLDYDKLNFPLQMRRWKEGDSFIPLGMNKPKKLSDFFIDQKFSKLQKSNTWLLCSGNKIVWIIGHRINDEFKITKTTKTAYFVRPLN